MISIQARNANVKLFISVSKIYFNSFVHYTWALAEFSEQFPRLVRYFSFKTNSSTDYIKNTSLI